MSTLVVCVDRTGDLARTAGLETPVVGWEAVQSLVLDVGLADPEDSGVNSLLEALRVTRDLGDDGEEAVVAVVSGTGEGVLGPDRAVAAQVEALVEEYDAESAVVVIDSAEDEQLLPVVESRVHVDSVDRVVVRQARDLESTYYLLKQFLADEELRGTVLVPLGTVLLVFPGLMMITGSLATAAASITAVLGLFLLYKGLGVEDYLGDLSAEARTALYSGRVSIVTYVVAAGLALIGVVAGALGVSEIGTEPAPLLASMAFAFDAVPWAAVAALTASAGRLVDEAIQDERLRTSYLNLPFGVVAVGLVVRGFSAYFLQRAGALEPVTVPPGIALTPEERLALFVVLGVAISIVGIVVASHFGGIELDRPEDHEATE